MLPTAGWSGQASRWRRKPRKPRLQSPPHCSSSPDLSPEWELATLMNSMRSPLAQGACAVPTPCTQQSARDLEEGRHRLQISGLPWQLLRLCTHWRGHRWAPLAHVCLRLRLPLQSATLPASKCISVCSVCTLCLSMSAHVVAFPCPFMYVFMCVWGQYAWKYMYVSLWMESFIKVTYWGLCACLPSQPLSRFSYWGLSPEWAHISQTQSFLETKCFHDCHFSMLPSPATPANQH